MRSAAVGRIFRPFDIRRLCGGPFAGVGQICGVAWTSSSRVGLRGPPGGPDAGARAAAAQRARSRSSTTSTSCSTRRCCPARRPGRWSPATSSCRCASSCKRTDLRLGRSSAPIPRQRCCGCARARGTSRSIHYDQLVVALGLGLADAADPGAGRARPRLQDAARGDRPAQPGARAAWRPPRRSTTPREREAWLTFVFVGAGYAGLEGGRRAAGLRRRRPRPLPALPHPGRAVRARRGRATG